MAKKKLNQSNVALKNLEDALASIQAIATWLNEYSEWYTAHGSEYPEAPPPVGNTVSIYTLITWYTAYIAWVKEYGTSGGNPVPPPPKVPPR